VKKKGHLKKNQKVEINPSFLNENIPFSQILLVNENETEIVTKQEALKKAREANLDLYCVALPAGDRPPVCKLINYEKHLFELKKNKPKKNKLSKEISINYSIADSDLKAKKIKDIYN